MTSDSEKTGQDYRSEFVERRQSVRTPVSPLGEAVGEGGLLKPLVFTTLDLEPSEQFLAWQQHMLPLLDLRLPDGIRPSDGFPASQTVWDLGGMLLIQQTAPAFSYERPKEKVRFSSIDHWQVSFLRSGHSWTCVDGRVAENEPGMIDVRSLGYPFRGRTVESESVSLIIPVDQFAGRGGMPESGNNVTLGGYRAKLLIDFDTSLEDGLSRATNEDLPDLRDSLREIIFDTIAPLVKKNDVSEQTSQFCLMSKARRFIQKNLMSRDLTPEALSRELAVSRTHLYQLFEGSGGVLNYIRQRRLFAAHAMLADASENRRVADVALAFGFDSAANFTRAFTQQFGYSPSSVRKPSARTETLPDSLQDQSQTVTFETLLRTLAMFDA